MAGGWSLRGFIIGISILLSLPCQAAADETKRIVHVTSNGWHSGIVIARADLPESAIPETADFPEVRPDVVGNLLEKGARTVEGRWRGDDARLALHTIALDGVASDETGTSDPRAT